DEAAVHAEPLHLLDHVAAERVITHAGDHPGVVAEARCGHGHVHRAAAEELAEAVDVLEALLDLQRVDVHTAAAESDDVEVCCHGSPCLPASKTCVGAVCGCCRVRRCPAVRRMLP